MRFAFGLQHNKLKTPLWWRARTGHRARECGVARETDPTQTRRGGRRASRDGARTEIQIEWRGREIKRKIK